MPRLEKVRNRLFRAIYYIFWISGLFYTTFNIYTNFVSYLNYWSEKYRARRSEIKVDSYWSIFSQLSEKEYENVDSIDLEELHKNTRSQ